MANPNQRNASDEAEKTPEKKEVLSTTLLREFAQSKINDKDNRASFVTDLKSRGDISPELLADIQKFADNDSKERFDDLEITPEKIRYAILNREVSSYFATLANHKQELKDMIVAEYDVTPASLSAKVDKHFDNLEEPEILKLISSESGRKAKLTEIYGAKKLPKTTTLSSFFQSFDLEGKIKSVDEDKQVDFMTTVEKIQSGQKIDTPDIETLLESGVFDTAQQKKLLQKMVPSMSLSKAKELGFITDKEIRTFKEGLVKKIFEGDSVDARSIAGEISEDELIFSTESLLDSTEHRMKMLDDPLIFIPFVKKYEKFIDDINDKIDESSLKKSEDFITKLGNDPKIHGASAFAPGSIIEIEQVQNIGGKQHVKKTYAEISEITDSGSFSIKERGSYDVETKSGGYDVNTRGTGKQRYSDFLSFLRDGNKVKGIAVQSMNVMTPGQLKEKIAAGEIQEASMNSLPIKEATKLQNESDSLAKQIEGKEKEIFREKDRIREELQLAKAAGKNSFTKAEIESEIEKNAHIKNLEQELQVLKNKKDKKVKEIKDVDKLNLKTLQEGIDSVDPDGKKIPFEKGVSFKTKNDVYTVMNIDPITKTISVMGVTGKQNDIDFQDFFQAFKSQDSKRVSNAKTYEELFSNMQNESDVWSNFMLKSDKIHKKGADKKPAKSGVVYDYLVAKKGKQLVRIEDVGGGEVIISFGKLKENPKRVGKGVDEEIEKNEEFVIYGGSSNMTFPVSYLEAFIKQHDLVPESLDKNKETTDPDTVNTLDKKFHVFSFLFKNISIMEAVKGGQQFYEQIREIMNQGQEEHALQFANMYLGKVLPKGGKQELQVRLENSQAKRMEEYLERLKKVGSDVATEMIKGYLRDTHGPEYPKEAAVKFMLEKYGVLNAKKLADWQGKFYWYQALGGKVNDELYNEIKEEVEKESLPFTEEYLVYRLMKKQCAPGGYKGIKRRSKLHKEVKKIRATGKEEERETGIRDGGDQRTCEGRVEGGMGELYSGNYPNAVGWLEQVVNKGGDMDVMNKMPFIMAFSGVAYNFEEKVTDDLKNFPAKTRVLMMLRFFSHHRDLELLNKTIMRVCEILDEKGTHPGIKAHASEIFNDRRGTGTKARLKKTENFYKMYGKDLTNIMYMLNTGEVDDNLNKLIFFEKDKPDPKNNILKEYYEHLHIWIDADTSFEDEVHMSDPFKFKGVSGMDINRVTKQLLGMRQGGSFTKHSAGPIMAEEILKEFEAIPQRTYSSNSTENRDMQKKLLIDNLRRMIAGFLELHGADPGRALAGYNAPSSPFQKLNKWGVYLTDFPELKGGASYEDLLHNHDPKYNPLLEKFADQIMRAEINNEDFTRPDKYSDKEHPAETVGDSVSQIVQKGSPRPSSSVARPGDIGFDDIE